MIGRSKAWAIVSMVVSVHAGCAEVSMPTSSTWHQKCGWKAEDYFDDSKVIALCRAIEANDVGEIDRLVTAGANVNAQGKAKMTPLLWAFPDNKLRRFQRLLEHGADPNIVIESDFDTRGGMSAGDSVTHLASKTAFPGYFEAVFAHGGDPNLERTSVVGSDDTPLFTVIKFGGGNKKQKIQLLIDNGTNLNHVNATGITPVMQAAGWGGQYDIALQLLNAGANPRIYQQNQMQKLAHIVVRQDTRLPQSTPQQRADYQKLVQWLNDHGESVDDARADIKRWDSWSRTTGEFSQKMDAEIAVRKAKEAREKAVGGKKFE